MQTNSEDDKAEPGGAAVEGAVKESKLTTAESFVKWMHSSGKADGLKDDCIQALLQISDSDMNALLRCEKASELKSFFTARFSFDMVSLKRVIKHVILWRDQSLILQNGNIEDEIDDSIIEQRHQSVELSVELTQVGYTIDNELQSVCSAIDQLRRALDNCSDSSFSSKILSNDESIKSMRMMESMDIDPHCSPLDRSLKENLIHLDSLMDEMIAPSLRRTQDHLLSMIDKLYNHKQCMLDKQAKCMRQAMDDLRTCKKRCDTVRWDQTIGLNSNNCSSIIIEHLCNNVLNSLLPLSDSQRLWCAPKMTLSPLINGDELCSKICQFRTLSCDRPSTAVFCDFNGRPLLNDDKSLETQKRSYSSVILRWIIQAGDLVTHFNIDYRLLHMSEEEMICKQIDPKSGWLNVIKEENISDTTIMNDDDTLMCEFQVPRHLVIGGFKYEWRVQLKNAFGWNEWTHPGFIALAPKLSLEFDRSAMSKSIHSSMMKRDSHNKNLIKIRSDATIRGHSTIPTTMMINSKYHRKMTVEFHLKKFGSRGLYIGFIHADHHHHRRHHHRGSDLKKKYPLNQYLGRNHSSSLTMRPEWGSMLKKRHCSNCATNVPIHKTIVRGDRLMFDLDFHRNKCDVIHNDHQRLKRVFEDLPQSVLFAISVSPRFGDNQVSIEHIPSGLSFKKRLRLMKKLKSAWMIIRHGSSDLDSTFKSNSNLLSLMPESDDDKVDSQSDSDSSDHMSSSIDSESSDSGSSSNDDRRSSRKRRKKKGKELAVPKENMIKMSKLRIDWDCGSSSLKKRGLAGKYGGKTRPKSAKAKAPLRTARRTSARIKR